jgi:hypothetical protein
VVAAFIVRTEFPSGSFSDRVTAVAPHRSPSSALPLVADAGPRRDTRLFVDAALKRAEHLIERQVWSGIDMARCRNWFAQFEERDMALLGACLLDVFVYRSRDQVPALLRQAMLDAACALDLPHDAALIDALRQRSDPGIRLAPVVHLAQPPTKSGPYVLRLLARTLRIRDEWLIWPEQIPRLGDAGGVRAVILVDDFCGTGRQFGAFERRLALSDWLRRAGQVRLLYLTAAAHRQGVSELRKTLPSLLVLPGELLDENDHVFSGTVLDQYRDPTLKEQLAEQHQTLCRRVGIGGSVGTDGFGHLGLAYAFAHGTPNNTLPIYWQETREWTPMVDR